LFVLFEFLPLTQLPSLDRISPPCHGIIKTGVNYNNPFGIVLGPVVDTIAGKLRRPDDGSRDLHPKFLDCVWSEFFNAVVAGKDLATVKLVTEEEVILSDLSGASPKDHAGLGSPTSIAALHANHYSYGMDDVASPPNLRRDGSTGVNLYKFEPRGICLTELERLKIVLKMCYTPKTSWYKYSSTHTVLGQEAMVVQSRIFLLPGDGSVEEYLGTAAALDAGHHTPVGDVVRVYEIAYGSDGSAKAKAPTALYFDIPAECITRRNATSPGHSSTVTMESFIETAPTKPFYIARPYDEDALALVVDILQLRIRELELPGKLDRLHGGSFLDRLVVDAENAAREESQILYAAKMGLGSQFHCLVSHYATIYWDRCAERADKTSSLDQPVLNVESKYTTQSHDVGTSGAKADTLWDTFVTESERLFQGDSLRGGRSSQAFANGSDSAGPIPLLKKAEDGVPWYAELDNSVRCWRDVLLSREGEGEWEYARQAVLGYKEQHPTARPDSRASARSTRSVQNGPTPAQSPMLSDPRARTPFLGVHTPQGASSGMESYNVYSSNQSRRPSFSDCHGSAATKRIKTPLTRRNSFAASPYSYAARSRSYDASPKAYAYDVLQSPPVQKVQYYEGDEVGFFY
jgi:hypothetical protein